MPLRDIVAENGAVVFSTLRLGLGSVSPHADVVAWQELLGLPQTGVFDTTTEAVTKALFPDSRGVVTPRIWSRAIKLPVVEPPYEGAKPVSWRATQDSTQRTTALVRANSIVRVGAEVAINPTPTIRVWDAFLARIPFLPARTRVVRAGMSRLDTKGSSMYWANVLPGLPRTSWPPNWCGAFCLWALHIAGLAKKWNWEIGKGFIYKGLTKTSTPLPGDIAYFTQFQHQALVHSVNSDQTVTLINGNSTNAYVRLSRPLLSSAEAYYSIEPVIKGLGS